MECYSNFPHSYDGQEASGAIFMGDYYFNVVDYEVFTTVGTATPDSETKSVLSSSTW